VEEVFQRWGVIWEVAVGGRVLRTTAEHPFWVRGRGWTAARQLRVGDALRSHDGQWLAVEDVRDTGRAEAVYNGRVAEYHTYFVGCDEWGFSLWAHNSCGPGGAPQAQFTVGRHGAMPSPRPGQQSHHGVMSAWMRSRYSHYDPDLAPAVLMAEINHQATFGVYNTWRAQMRQRMGGTFDWSRVSEAEMRALSERMFDAAQVPASVRQQYWAEYQRMIQALQRQAGGG
jgi:hypothetical protein